MPSYARTDAAPQAIAEQSPETSTVQSDAGAFRGGGTIPPVVTGATNGNAGSSASASDRAFGAETVPHAETPAAAPASRPAAEGEVLSVPHDQLIFGIRVVAPVGTHVSAIDECVGFIRDEISKNEYAQQHMAKAKVTIIIIPVGVPMTDVAQFASLRGQKTMDGRDWATVRGSGGTTAADGSFAVGIAEESLIDVKAVVNQIAGPPAPPYAAGYSVGTHEFAHSVEAKGMTPAQQKRVIELYNAHKAAKGDFTDDYAAVNEREYFAQCTNAFFGRNAMGTNHNGRDWLQAHDPEMYAFLVSLYEQSYDKKGKEI